MRRRATIILALSCLPLVAQQSVMIPPPLVDGTTCQVAATTGVLSCVGSMTYNATTGVLAFNGVPITNLSLQTLSLTGGPNYSDGVYNVTMTGGVATLTPYTPATGKTYSVTLPTTNGTSWTLVPGLTLAIGQQATVMAVSPHTGPPATTDWFYYSTPRVQTDSAGAVYVGLSNATATQITKAQVVVTVQ